MYGEPVRLDVSIQSLHGLDANLGIYNAGSNIQRQLLSTERLYIQSLSLVAASGDPSQPVTIYSDTDNAGGPPAPGETLLVFGQGTVVLYLGGPKGCGIPGGRGANINIYISGPSPAVATLVGTGVIMQS